MAYAYKQDPEDWDDHTYYTRRAGVLWLIKSGFLAPPPLADNQ